MTEAETVAPDPRQEPCPNCGDTATGNYCPTCGQQKAERKLTLKRVLKDAIEDQLSFNSGLSRTVRSLLFKPGHLTVEYLRGRIASYIPPFRLYLITSFLMFLVLQTFGGRGGALVQFSAADMSTDSASVARVDSTRQERVTAGDTTDFNLPLGDGALEDRARAKIDRIKKLEGAEMNRLFAREFWGRLPIVIILLVPGFAALIGLLYWRHHLVYVEHFIFALHVHAFAFLAVSVMVMTNKTISMILAAGIAVYTLLALRRVYGQTLLKTILKLFVLGIAYMIMLLPVILTGIALALMFMPV